MDARNSPLSHAFRAQRRPVVGDDDATDEVGGRIGDEHVAVEPAGSRSPRYTIGAQTAVNCECAVGVVDAGLVGADGPDSATGQTS